MSEIPEPVLERAAQALTRYMAGDERGWSYMQGEAAVVLEAAGYAEMVAELGQVHTELEEAANLLAGAGLKGMASIYRAAAKRVGRVFARASQTNTGE